jgi:hypothetical protein
MRSTNRHVTTTGILSTVLIAFLVACSPGRSKLDTPSNITFDNQVVRWSPVRNARKYQTSVNNSTESIESDTNEVVYEVPETVRTITIKVKAIPDEEVNDNLVESEFSEVVTFTQLDDVQNIRISDGIVRWDSVSGAEKYFIRINDVEEELGNVTSYNGLVANEASRVEVRAARSPISSTEQFFGLYNQFKNFNILSSPILSFEKSTRTINWNSIPNATGYTVKITKPNNQTEIIPLSNSQTFYNGFSFLDVGSHQISIKSTSNSQSKQDSKYSGLTEVLRLSAPASNSISLSYDRLVSSTRITFNSVPNANTYNFFINDQLINKKLSPNTTSVFFDHTFTSNSVNEINHSIKIQSDSNSSNTLESLTYLEFSLKQLATPSNLRVTGNTLLWDEVSNATGYYVQLTGKSEQIFSNTNSLDLSLHLSPGASIYTASVRAAGNGTLYVTSNPSNNVQITKLATPTNIQITNNLVTWDLVPGATGYRIRIGSGITENSVNNAYLLNLSTIPTGVGTEIYISAVGNGNLTLNSDEGTMKNNQGQERTIRRLNKPINLRTTESQIIWQSGEQSSIPKNFVLKVNSATINLTSESYSWSLLTAGPKTITVVHKGDGSSTFDSEESTAITVTKLNAPDVTVNDTNISWSNVTGAAGYRVMVGNDANNSLTLPSTQTTFTYNFNEKIGAGNQAITVKALGNSVNTTDSEETKVFKNVQTLNTPQVSNFNVTKVDNNFRVEITQSIPNAIGYIYRVGSQSSTLVTENFFTVPINDPGLYQFSIKAVGDGFSYIDSNFSQSINVTVLTPVNNATLDFDSGNIYNLNWAPINSAVNYKVDVQKFDASGNPLPATDPFFVSNTVLSINMANTASVRIRITVRGNGTTIFDSSVFEKTFSIQGN